MVILNSDHPDIEEFVECKADAEKKAHALIEAGYSGAFNVPNGAYDSVYFQNANHSVRATDDFMRAVELDRDWSMREVTTGNVTKTLKSAGTDAENGGSDLGVRRPRNAVRHHREPVAHLREHGAHQCLESVLCYR